MEVSGEAPHTGAASPVVPGQGSFRPLWRGEGGEDLAAAPGAVSLAAQGALGLPASPGPLKGLPGHCGAGCTLVSGVSSWACDVTCDVTMGLCVVYLEVCDIGWEGGSSRDFPWRTQFSPLLFPTPKEKGRNAGS